MKILLAAAEAAPYAKAGGLADVAGSLPKFISSSEYDIRLILPFYGSIKHKFLDIKNVENSLLNIEFGNKTIHVSLNQAKLPDSNVTVYFVDNEEYFGSHNEIYPKKKYARFEQERFIVFGLSILKLMEKIGFKPDIIHCNDWHTANIPVYLKTLLAGSKFYQDTRVLFSIHNLAYQGLYSPDILEFANLKGYNLFWPDKLEFYNDVSWMKGGIVYSDIVNTVSKTYAKEIQTKEYGEKLEGLLREKSYKLFGVLNGIDYSYWNPLHDKKIAQNYLLSDLSGKQKCKSSLQKELKLPVDPDVPFIGLISRFADQKGLDIVEALSEDFRTLNIQLAILGSGEEKYELAFKDLGAASKHVSTTVGFNADLAQKIYAGADMFLMPSRFEPCGLGQLIALKYGTIPIVRETGGLADTICDFSLDNEHGNGFIFKEYDSNKLLETMTRAISLYSNKKVWNKLIYNAMSSDFSWEKSAQEYIELYKKTKNILL